MNVECVIQSLTQASRTAPKLNSQHLGDEV